MCNELTEHEGPNPLKELKGMTCQHCNEDWCDGIQRFGTDPYRVEISGDYTPRWMCRGQRFQSARDI
jgi:hypothetical protein